MATKSVRGQHAPSGAQAHPQPAAVPADPPKPAAQCAAAHLKALQLANISHETMAEELEGMPVEPGEPVETGYVRRCIVVLRDIAEGLAVNLQPAPLTADMAHRWIGDSFEAQALAMAVAGAWPNSPAATAAQSYAKAMGAVARLLDRSDWPAVESDSTETADGDQDGTDPQTVSMPKDQHDLALRAVWEVTCLAETLLKHIVSDMDRLELNAVSRCMLQRIHSLADSLIYRALAMDEDVPDDENLCDMQRAYRGEVAA